MIANIPNVIVGILFIIVSISGKIINYTINGYSHLKNLKIIDNFTISFF